MNNSTTFFSVKLLDKLKFEEPIRIALQSQIESANVGFDFLNINIAFDRLTDEIRELSEAMQEADQGSEAVAHLCDEATDVIFGTVNVLRHAGVPELEMFQNLCPGKDMNIEAKEIFHEVVKNFNVFSNSFNAYQIDNQLYGSFVTSSTSLMQSALNLVFAFKVDPNEVMRKNVEKYLMRCKYIENVLESRNQEWKDITLEEIYQLWKEAKKSGL